MNPLFPLLAFLLTLSSCENEYYKLTHRSEKVSCLDHLNSDPSLPNGQYEINHDLDESTQMISVYCNMLGGGWTQIVYGSSTTVNDLAIFGDTNEIASTFYSDPAMGIGWGESVATGGSNANCSFAPKFVMGHLWDYQAIKIVVSGTYNVATDIDNSLGYLYISNNLSDGNASIASFIDAWSADASGSNQINVGATTIRGRNDTATDLIGYGFIIPATGNQLQFCMGGEQPLAYNKRYILSLWLK